VCLFSEPLFKFGILQSVCQQVALGGLLIALPMYLQIDLGYNALQAGLSLAPLSLTMFVIALLAGRRAGRRRPSALIRAGFLLHGVDVAAWPGGLTSSAHTGDDVARTVAAFEGTFDMLAAEGAL